MPTNEIDELQIKISETGTDAAVKKLTELRDTLKSIKSSIGRFGKNQSNAKDRLGEIADNVEEGDLEKLRRLADVIEKIKNIGTIKISAAFANAIGRISEQIKTLTDDSISRFDRLANVLIKMKNAGIDNMNVRANLRSPIERTESNYTPDEFYKAAPIKTKSTITYLSRIEALANRIKRLRVGESIGSSFKNATPQLKKFQDALGKSFKSIKKSIGMYGKMIVFSVLFRSFNAITNAFKEGRDNLYQYSKTINGPFAKSLDSITTSLAYLKNSIATVFAPIINSLAPAIETITNKVVEFANTLSRAFAVLTGASTYVKATRSATEYADAVDKATEANKNLKKTILGIDQINPLADNTADTTAATKTDTPNYSDMFETVSVGGDDVVEQIKKKIADVESVLGLAAFAIGAILTFSGINIPLGITLMALGAAALWHAKKLDWETTGDKVKTKLEWLAKILGVALFAVGAILAFSGINIPLGITLMAGGAALAATATALSWDGLSDNIKNVITIIALAVGAAALVIGVILAFTGVNIPVGIALIAIGAATMATAAAIGWDKLSDKTQKVISIIAGVAGAALLAIGVILCLTGAAIPLGIGMIVAGAAGIATSIKLNWGSIVDSVKKTFKKIKEQFSKFWKDIKTWFSQKWDGFKKFGSTMITKIKDGIGNIWKKTKQKFTDFWTGLKKWFGEKWNGFVEFGSTSISKIKSGIGNIWGTIKEKFSNFYSKTSEWFSGKWDKFIDFGSNIVSKIKNGIGNIWKKVKEKFSNFWEKLTDWFSGKGEKDDLGESLVDNIKNGVSGIWDKVKQKFTDFWDSLKQWFRGKTLDVKVEWDTTSTIGGALSKFGLPGIPKLSFFENGGFPTVGEMFIAKENGPEMVGRIGNKTAVANEGQIVSSVTNGVAKGVQSANAEQNALLREQNRLLKKLLEKQTTTVISTKTIESAFERSNRRTGKVSV